MTLKANDLTKARKLLDDLRVLDAKRAATLDELDSVLGGRSLGPEMKAFADHFDAVWGQVHAGGQTGAYVWTYAKDKPQVRRLLLKLGLETLKARATVYLANQEPFYCNAKHPFALFVSGINRWTDESEEREQVEGCRHSPPCATETACTKLRMADSRRM